MAIQSLLFFCVILWGGTIEELNNNALDILNERVINRKNYLENERVQRFSNIDEPVKIITTSVQKTLNNQNAKAEDIGSKEGLTESILLDNSSNLIYVLRKNGVTGVFLTLTENDKKYGLSTADTVKKPALYIRDADPGADIEDQSDLSIERAPVNVTKALDIAMSSSWEANLSFSGNAPNQSDFYYKPLRASCDYPDLQYKDLGYWSKPFMLGNDENTVVTYSVPLKTKDGALYGVFGVEISLEYLHKNLPNDELNSSGDASYLLAIDDGTTEKNEFTNVVTSGTAYQRIVGNADKTFFEDEPFYNSTYRLEKSE